MGLDAPEWRLVLTSNLHLNTRCFSTLPTQNKMPAINGYLAGTMANSGEIRLLLTLTLTLS